MRIFILLLLVLGTLSACTRGDGRTFARHMQQHGFVPQQFETTNFVLFGMLRLSPAEQSDPEDILQVYIEGDGFAWQSRTRPSNDPTPHNPVGLRLAQADKSGHAVLYLARPCQFIAGPDARMCRVAYWTSARFASEVVQSMNEAIDQAKEQIGVRHVRLTGYSGGGGLAVLLAAQRQDVTFLGTIAANLDHAAWTTLHGASPLSRSLNPLDAAPQVRHVPQLHLSSRADSVIPPGISQKFCQAIYSPQSCTVVENVPHSGPWEELWGAYCP